MLFEGLIIGIAAAGTLSILGILLQLWYWWRDNQHQNQNQMDSLSSVDEPIVQRLI